MNKLLIFLSLLLFSISSSGQVINKTNLDELLKKAEETHSEAIIIYKDNQLVTEKYFGIGKPGNKIEAMSCTKSIAGLAIACLLTDGLIDSLDTPVYFYYPEWKQGMKQAITIRHLVNMTSGIQNNPNASVEIYPSRDFVQLALAAELTTKPGAVWSYNNKSLNLIAGIVKKITGKRMDVYIGQRLFKPLNITDYSWTLDSAGNPHVMSGCQVKPMDFIKLGLLVLNKGKYKNKQVISAGMMEKLVEPCPQFKAYGMLWWIDYEHSVSVVDDEIIANMKKAGIDAAFIAKAEQMKGRYETIVDYNQKLQAVFGQNPMEYINDNLGASGLPLKKREYSGSISYRADGYLGNYLIVDPVTKIVAVRMISHASFKTENDNFQDFKEMVRRL